ncbi:MAG: hypothetical protein K0S07_1314 [Chlamydiales bacterium]|jgi:UPF0176 protein|nr:hypothetical protein [Chlamydiales bacterium]
MTEIFGFLWQRSESSAIPEEAYAHPVWVLAYYAFTPVNDPAQFVKDHHAFFKGREATGRLYISEEGINGQMSATSQDALAYMEWLTSHESFATLSFKVHGSSEQVFPRMTVKYRKQLVALDCPTDLQRRGNYLSPQEWRATLESDEDYILLDVRNDYEWQIGHFKQSTLPPCSTFREFIQFAGELKEKVDASSKKVLMCCTGGIRCEVFSSHLKEIGFENVHQLEGGIIKYGLEEKGKHWLGKLFVFDDRLAISVNPQDSQVIGCCRHCNQPNETYYNCANMDCNALFLCCPECLAKEKGCCSSSCQDQPRVRPVPESSKPFRKWYHYAKTKPEFLRKFN